MERRKNSNLHVVREPEDPTDKIIDEIMDELNSEDGMPFHYRHHKSRKYSDSYDDSIICDIESKDCDMIADRF